jgi:hypothetical protein
MVTLHAFGQVDGSSMVMAYVPCIVSKVLKACNDNGDVQVVQLPWKRLTNALKAMVVVQIIVAWLSLDRGG